MLGKCKMFSALSNSARNGAMFYRYAMAVLLAGIGLGAAAQTVSLADQPVFASSQVAGNLALALSVEYPTVTRVAHTDAYTPSKEFLGHFDPKKCYTYQANTSNPNASYFAPAGLASNHTCTGKWSGNFLNWATHAAIDPFRWAMTGGRRVVDTATETILEKGRHSGQGSLFPDRTLPADLIAGATPFSSNDAGGGMRISVNGRGYKMRFSPIVGFQVEYFNNTTGNFNGTPVYIEHQPVIKKSWSGSPGSGVNNDFSSRWTGSFTAPNNSYYQFRMRQDDNATLYIDDTKVAEASGWVDFNNGNWTTSSRVGAKSGTVNFKIEHVDTGGGASIYLQWRRCKNTSSSNCNTGTASHWNDWQDFSHGGSSYTEADYNGGSTLQSIYDAVVRVKVCDPSAAAGGVEANCVQYGSNWKPEGLVQEYAQRMRFSAFGYMNQDGNGRDGGVLRARQKFVGPTKPEPGQNPVANTLKEWSATDGTFVRNPDAVDATSTNTWAGLSGNDRVQDSGVIGYLNGFGQIIDGNYKSNDPVNELYYATLRYFRGLDNIDAWSNIADGTSTADKKKWLDGFPIIRDWTAQDPILYSCQRNFVLGIGDINTHGDKNVPGTTDPDSTPSTPSFGADGTFFDAFRSTNNLKKLQGMGENKANVSTGSNMSNDYMAGLAFEANTRDIRPDNANTPNSIGKQTVQTYWVDVLENGFVTNNKFYLTGKFGGLDRSKLPTGFDPYTFDGEIPLDWWSTNGKKIGGQDKPNNYFTAGQPDDMVAGLREAFQSIAAAVRSYTTALAYTSPNITSGDMAYASQYDSNNWSGTVSGRTIAYPATGDPTVTEVWRTDTTLAQQVAADSGAGWDTQRRIVTWGGSDAKGVPFRYDQLSATQKSSLNTSYVAADDGAVYLNYLRGSRKDESNSTAVDSLRQYRPRDTLLGDIVNAKLTAAGPPSAPLITARNPGYGAFKNTYKARATVVYAGANDGMLHAFNGADGQEIFAYVPGDMFKTAGGLSDSLLANYGNPNYEHRYMVDAAPVVVDVDFSKTQGSAEGAAPDWRSVLIGGLGKGGKSYYALDVTDPSAMTTEAAVAGKVLWETDLSEMGYSFGRPWAVKTAKYGWVIILTSGYDSSSTVGLIFLINPKTGALIEKIATSAAAPGLTHASAYGADVGDGTVSAVYAGDLNGQLWRFDLTQEDGAVAYPAGKKIAQLTNAAGDALPITTPPLVAIDPATRVRYVMVGTGQLLNTTDIASTQVQSFFAIKDGGVAHFAAHDTPVTRSALKAVTDLTQGYTLGTGETALGVKGWYHDLGKDNATGIGWRMVDEMDVANGIVAFITTLTSGDACNPSGRSRLYAVQLGSGRTAWSTGESFLEYGYSLISVQLVNKDGKLSVNAAGRDPNNDGAPVSLPDIVSGSGTALQMLNWRETFAVD